MHATNKWIDDLIKGEYLAGSDVLPEDFRGMVESNPYFLNYLLMLPAAWKAVGKARGWSNNEVVKKWDTFHYSVWFNSIEESLAGIE